MKYWMLLFIIPVLIFFLLYFFIPHAEANPFISAALAVSFAGAIVTLMQEAKIGALLINGGFIAFVIQYFTILSIFIGDPVAILLLWFFAILLEAIIFLLNISYLGSREKISEDTHQNLNNLGSTVLLLDVLTIIVYSSYFWWFGNLVSSFGLGLIILGAILPIFRNLIPSKKLVILLTVNVFNLGLALLIYGGIYFISMNYLMSFFLTCAIGFLIHLCLNAIVSSATEIISTTVWNKIFILDFLCVSIFGISFFNFLLFDMLIWTVIVILWILSISFATMYFAFKGELISEELYSTSRLIAGFGISLDLATLFAVLVLNVATPLLAGGTFGVAVGFLMIIFNIPLKKKFLYYINSINLIWGFGIIIATPIYLRYLDLVNAIFGALLVITALLIGILLLGLGRKFLEKRDYYQLNLINWMILSFTVGFLLGWNIPIIEIGIFVGLLVGTFLFSVSLVWAKAGELITKEQLYRFSLYISALINLQLAIVFSLFTLRYPNGWMGFSACFLIFFGLLMIPLLAIVAGKRFIILNQASVSFGIILALIWVNIAGEPVLSSFLAIWIGLIVFQLIIPVSFGLKVGTVQQLYRFTLVTYLFFTIISTSVLSLVLISIEITTLVFLLVILVTLMLFPAYYFGFKGDLFPERSYFALSSVNFSLIVAFICFFLWSLPWFDVYYQYTFVFFTFFLLLIPDLYIVYRAQFLDEQRYRKVLEFVGHLLVANLALILAGIPILVASDWVLAVGIFFTVFPLFSAPIHLYYKRNVPFMVVFCLFFVGLFIFLYNLIILVVIDLIATVFLVLSIDLFLGLIMLSLYKQYELISRRSASLGIFLDSIALSFTVSFLVGVLLQAFLPLAIIVAIYLFLLLSRIVFKHGDIEEFLTETQKSRILEISLWSCVIANSVFLYFLLNTLNPTYYTTPEYQAFNITFVVFVSIGMACIFSEAFRKLVVKIITDKRFLTVSCAAFGIFISSIITIYANNLFLGVALAILIILIGWKAIYSSEYFGNYFIIGVPVVLGVIIYKSIFDFISPYATFQYFDSLYILFDCLAIVTCLYFFLSLTLWKFKSNLKFGLIGATTFFILLTLIYNAYYLANPMILTFSAFFLSVLPWLVSGFLISNLWLYLYFKKQGWAIFSIFFVGIFLLFTLIGFNALFLTQEIYIRVMVSCFTSAGLSFFIFSMFMKRFSLLQENQVVILLGISVISGSLAVWSGLFFYQGVELVISIGLAIDFGVFFYYLCLACYFWELSKRIWEKGWQAWIAIPVVNAFLVYLSFQPLGMEFQVFGACLAISLFTILLLPIVFYRWRENFRLSWFIVWAELIPLSYVTAFFFWFQEIFVATIFTMVIITFTFAIVVYFLKIWKVSALLWAGLSIGNGVAFFLTGYGRNFLSLISISLLIVGFQLTLITTFPNIPKKIGRISWPLVSVGITFLAIFFALVNNFDQVITVLFAGLIFLFSLYPLVLFEVERRWVNRIIGFGACFLIPIFMYFLLFNSFFMFDATARSLISAAISSIILGFELLVLNKFQVLKRNWWIYSWMYVSASIALLFSWFGVYVFFITDNIFNFLLTALIFELLIIPSSTKFWKVLWQAITITSSILLGFLVSFVVLTPAGEFPVLQSEYITLYPIFLIPLVCYFTSTLILLKVTKYTKTRIGIATWSGFSVVSAFLILWGLRILHIPEFPVPFDEFLAALFIAMLVGMALCSRLETFGVDKKYLFIFTIISFVSATLLVYQLAGLIIGFDIVARILLSLTIGLYLFLFYSRSYEKLFDYLLFSANGCLSLFIFTIGTIYVSIYLGLALGLIIFAILLSFQKEYFRRSPRFSEQHLKSIQEIILSVGLFFFLFWMLLIVIEPWALYISGFVYFFYVFIRSMTKGWWLIANILYVALIVVPTAVGVWMLSDTYLKLDLSYSTLYISCTILALGLILPALRKVPKKIVAGLWVALGCSLSILFYGPLSSILSGVVTWILLIGFFTLFIMSLPLFDHSSDWLWIGGTALSIAGTALLFNYIYLFTADMVLTVSYALLIELSISLIITFSRKKWTFSWIVWYSMAINIGFLVGYYTFLVVGEFGVIQFMNALIVTGILLSIPSFSSKFSVNERFISYMIFTVAITLGLSYYSSYLFVGPELFIYVVAFGAFLFSGLILIFYSSLKNVIQSQTLLDRFYNSFFWMILGIFNISTCILFFWCFFILLAIESLWLSLIITITIGYALFLLSKRFRDFLGPYLSYAYVIFPLFILGFFFFGLMYMAPGLDIMLISYFTFLLAFGFYWGFKKSDLIKWRIPEFLWAISPLPLTIFIANLNILYTGDHLLSISLGFLIYSVLLLPLFIVSIENEQYTDVLWSFFTVSLTLTLYCWMLRFAVVLPDDAILYAAVALTVGLNLALGRAFWQKHKKLIRILYVALTFAVFFTIYYSLVNLVAVAAWPDAFFLGLFAWGNLIALSAAFPEMNWGMYKYIWIMISTCFAFIGFYWIGIEFAALLPGIMIGLMIFSVLWIKPPLSPVEFDLRKYMFSIMTLALNVGLGWLLIEVLKVDWLIGVFVPVLVGILIIFVLSLKDVIPKRYWKNIYIFIPIIGGFLSMYTFWVYGVIRYQSDPDIYLNTIVPILIGLVLIVPLVVEYEPFRLLTKNTKILMVCIAATMAIFTFIATGYIHPFIRDQTMLKVLFAAVAVIVFIYPIFPRAYQWTDYTLLYLAALGAVGGSISYFFFAPDADFMMRIWFIILISIAAGCFGSFKLVKRKEAQNPSYAYLRLGLLVGGFIDTLVLIILMFIVHIA
ncbi:MAG: hypothetical protein HWN65_19810 [Candidatus Helarchaeota archaeon]|nr:hypothetical protein [Candidatus Helarchaeota archaeon]